MKMGWYVEWLSFFFVSSICASTQEAFDLVDDELTKQRNRLKLVTWFLWLIPIGLFILWLLLSVPSPAAIHP